MFPSLFLGSIEIQGMEYGVCFTKWCFWTLNYSGPLWMSNGCPQLHTISEMPEQYGWWTQKFPGTLISFPTQM